jgi:hypothetical protein
MCHAALSIAGHSGGPSGSIWWFQDRADDVPIAPVQMSRRGATSAAILTGIMREMRPAPAPLGQRCYRSEGGGASIRRP